MIPVVSNSNCDDAYGGGITSNMICAGLLNVGGKDSCQVRHQTSYEPFMYQEPKLICLDHLHTLHYH